MFYFDANALISVSVFVQVCRIRRHTSTDPHPQRALVSAPASAHASRSPSRTRRARAEPRGAKRCVDAFNSVMQSNLTLFGCISGGDWPMLAFPIIQMYPWTAARSPNEKAPRSASMPLAFFFARSASRSDAVVALCVSLRRQLCFRAMSLCLRHTLHFYGPVHCCSNHSASRHPSLRSAAWRCARRNARWVTIFFVPCVAFQRFTRRRSDPLCVYSKHGTSTYRARCNAWGRDRSTPASEGARGLFCSSGRVYRGLRRANWSVPVSHAGLVS